MYLVWPQTDSWEALREAITPALVPALEGYTPAAPVVLVEGHPAGPELALSRTGLILSPELLGPDTHTRQDRHWLASAPEALAPLALDRWKRSTGLIAEGLLLHRMAAQLGCPPEALPLTWWTLGAAAEELDRNTPELGWLWQSAAGLLQLPWHSMDDQPRRGAWFFRWRREQGRPLLIGTAAPPLITAEEWAEFGQWCRDPRHGPAATAPLPLPVAAPRAVPTEPVPPLSHHPMRWVAGPAGLRVDGAALSPPVRLGGGEDVVTVLGAVQGGLSPLVARTAPLVGRWLLYAGHARQRPGVAEGIELHFHPGGRLEITLGNAWMGPSDSESLLTRQLGASGSGSGRWQVRSLGESDGDGVMVLSDLNIDQISVHPRRTRMRRFALPAADNHLARVRRLLDQLTDQPVTFTLVGGELVLDGELRNFTFQIRLKPA
jgi:hypothetical protein